LNHIGKRNAAYPEYIGDSSLVKQNPTRLRKNAKKETDLGTLCEMVTLTLFLFFPFFSQQRKFAPE
jgi:hypothetical protein